MRSLRRSLPSGNALFFFEAAARCGNLTRAAEDLCVTQPAVSKMLARMEAHLGVKLFERVRTGIELTENGKILYHRIAEGFSGIEKGIEEINARVTGLQAVTLSASTAFTMHWLIPRLHRLKERHPTVDLRLQLNPGRIGEPMVDVDLCVGLLKEDDIPADRIVLMPETLIAVCSASYNEQVPRDAQGAPVNTMLLMGDSEYGWHNRFAGFAAEKQASYNALRFDDYSVVVQAAVLGQGVALGWLNVVAGCLVAKSLLPAKQEIIVTGRQCCLVSPQGRSDNPIVADVRDWIAEEMRQDLLALDAEYPLLNLAAKFLEARVQLG